MLFYLFRLRARARVEGAAACASGAKAHATAQATRAWRGARARWDSSASFLLPSLERGGRKGTIDVVVSTCVMCVCSMPSYRWESGDALSQDERQREEGPMKSGRQRRRRRRSTRVAAAATAAPRENQKGNRYLLASHTHQFDRAHERVGEPSLRGSPTHAQLAARSPFATEAASLFLKEESRNLSPNRHRTPSPLPIQAREAELRAAHPNNSCT